MFDASKDTLSALGIEAGERIVYVREVARDEISEDQAEATRGMEKVYAVHDGAGNRLGLFGNREMAFYVSRQHELAPVSVH